jgi:hypothetical protein
MIGPVMVSLCSPPDEKPEPSFSSLRPKSLNSDHMRRRSSETPTPGPRSKPAWDGRHHVGIQRAGRPQAEGTVESLTTNPTRCADSKYPSDVRLEPHPPSSTDGLGLPPPQPPTVSALPAAPAPQGHPPATREAPSPAIHPLPVPRRGHQRLHTPAQDAPAHHGAHTAA